MSHADANFRNTAGSPNYYLGFDPGRGPVAVPSRLNNLPPFIELECGVPAYATLYSTGLKATYRTPNLITNQKYFARVCTFVADTEGDYMIIVASTQFSPYITLVRDSSHKWSSGTGTLEVTLDATTIGPMTLEISSVLPYMAGDFQVDLSCPSNLTAIWLFEDAVGPDAPKVDSIQELRLESIGSTDSPEGPGLFNLGLRYPATQGGAYVLTPGLEPAQKFAYTSPDGFSMFVWFNIIAEGDGSAFGGPYVSTQLGNGTVAVFVGDRNDVRGNVTVRLFSHYFRLFVTLGTWHFFHGFYDPDAGKLGYSIDAGTEVLDPASATPTTAAFGSVSTSAVWYSEDGDVTFDLFGVFRDKKLTPAQVTWLYNDGVGRDWPFSLP